MLRHSNLASAFKFGERLHKVFIIDKETWDFHLCAILCGYLHSHLPLKNTVNQEKHSEKLTSAV